MGSGTRWNRSGAAAVGGVVALTLVASACGSGATSSARSTTTTGAVRVAVADPVCPTDPAAPPERPERPGLAHALVPPGAAAAVVCRYGGLSSSPSGVGGTPVAQATLPGPDVPALVAELDSPAWRPIDPDAAYSCPISDGGQDVVRFAFPSGPGVQVTVATSGCQFATNGVRTVDGEGIVQYLTRWIGESTGGST